MVLFELQLVMEPTDWPGEPNFLMATDIVKAFRWTTLMLALDLNLGTELSPPTPAETGVS